MKELISEIIKERRQALKIPVAEIIQRLGITTEEYRDIEQHPDELMTVVPLTKTIKLCDILAINLLDLIDDTTTEPSVLETTLSRHELIRQERKSIGLSCRELGDRLGFDENEMSLLETEPDHIDSWPIAYIKELAQALNVPSHILLV